ncbi:metallophosphoesterase family protein [Geodermatophilus saharensis]|uniref:metallophosphoesterase family protein n=1 Tax=Geodermatophilus saharensis TaxID=1137994 RepID=UPI0015963AC2|nr:metallophosphoesterase [Geodermatophilus saharensis]
MIEAAPLSHLHQSKFESHLSWLHISDMHITADFADNTSDTAADLERFLEDLPSCLEEAEIAPDAVFFTGDVAQSGAAEEYESAETFFVELQERLPHQSRFAPLIIVPGNHDVTWDAIDPKTELKLRRELSNTNNADAICDAADAYIRERHRNYEDFLISGKSAIRVPGDGERFFAHKFFAPVRGVEVGVAAFDSALLSTRKDLVGKATASAVGDLDLQFLRLGRRQLRSVAAPLKDCTIRIALMHHEPLSEWYADPDRELQRQELTKYDFVLRGHQHETRARVAPKIAGSDDFIELAPGALHTQPHWFQGFMAVELDLKSHLMRVTVWSVTGHARRWMRDREFGEDGRTLRALPDKVIRRLRD